MRIARTIFLFILAAGVLLFTCWGVLALWHRLPGPPALRGAGAGAFALTGFAAASLMVTTLRWRAISAFAILAIALVTWWGSIKPPAQADFAPDVARQVHGKLEGGRLTLSDMRAFVWRDEQDFDIRWRERNYDAAGPMTLDLFLSFWDDSGIAHMIMSFGFADGQHLAWSVEVKRLNGAVYSPVASAFKENALVLIAADEEDIIGLRTNIRGEDVRRFRLNLRQETIRSVLAEYVAMANALHREPRFYNSLTTNCTTSIVAMMRAVGATVPLDWRLILNGRLPDYAFEHKALEEGLTLEQAKAKAPVSAKARAHGLSEGFSAAIRQ